MTQKDLKHLRRADLLELLLEQSRENEALRSENEQLREQQSQQDILLDNAGSIAEASLRLNGVFEAAQHPYKTPHQNGEGNTGKLPENSRGNPERM